MWRPTQETCVTTPIGEPFHDTEPQSGKPEYRTLLAIALPLSAAYLSEFAMFVTTKIVVGSLGHKEFAAVGLAGDLSFEVLVILMGLLSIVGVLVAQAEGAGRKYEAGQAARQGFVVATLVGIAATVFIWNLDKVLALTDQDPEILALGKPYLKGLSGFVLPVLWFAVLRNFVAAIAKTGAVMVITVAAVGLNYGLAVVLVHGSPWSAGLGVFGAGLATSLVSWVMFIALAVYVFRTRSLRGYGLFKGKLRLNLAICSDIVRLGLPVAGLVSLEAGLFVAVAVLSGVLGVYALAAYEILMAWVGIPFVIALGLAEATMVRVAYGIGRGDPVMARKSGFLGMGIGVVMLSALIIVPISLPDVIVGLFIETNDPGYAEIAALTRQLLIVVAIFQVFDGLQAIASRSLRGVKDTIAPLWMAAFGYWVLGIGGGSYLAFQTDLASRGLWWGLALGLVVTSLMLTWRFERLTRRLVVHDRA